MEFECSSKNEGWTDHKNKKVHTTRTIEPCIYHHHARESNYPNSDTQAIELGWNAETESTRALFQLQR